jgi:hypothetical protein
LCRVPRFKSGCFAYVSKPGTPNHGLVVQLIEWDHIDARLVWLARTLGRPIILFDEKTGEFGTETSTEAYFDEGRLRRCSAPASSLTRGAR